jgi:hypothetical protein
LFKNPIRCSEVKQEGDTKTVLANWATLVNNNNDMRNGHTFLRWRKRLALKT